jgi:hypothetical protein
VLEDDEELWPWENHHVEPLPPGEWAMDVGEPAVMP